MKRLLTICLLFAGAATYAQTDEIKSTLKVLNTYRAACGLAPVTASAALSAGCAAHAHYLVLNKGNAKTAGMEAHKEYPELPGYSKAGELAGLKSVISFGNSLPSSIEGFMATLYHRIPLLQPDLREIGFGSEDGIILIECISGTAGKVVAEVVLCPGENQTNVPLYMAPEIPDPAPTDTNFYHGFPVTIYFCKGQAVKDVTFSLTDSKKKTVPCYISTPAKPATYFMQWNTVCAIPQRQLDANTKYTVSVSCTLNDKPYSRSYTFTTTK